jgi:hypothetical protein
MIRRFDPASQLLLQVFVRKLTFLLMIAAGLSLAAPQKLALACMLLQAQCLFSGAMSIGFGLSARQRFDAATLTYWDEAVAFSGVGLLAHFGTRMFA